jgi:hypothetical protein
VPGRLVRRIDTLGTLRTFGQVSPGPAAHGRQTRAKLAQTADDLGPTGRDIESGWGRVNLNDVLTE